MKFNPDCMRDILFYLEENLAFSDDLEPKYVSIQGLSENLPYTIQEIANMNQRYFPDFLWRINTYG